MPFLAKIRLWRYGGGLALGALLGACGPAAESPHFGWEQSVWRAPVAEAAMPRARVGASVAHAPRVAVVQAAGLHKQIQVLEWGDRLFTIANPLPACTGDSPPRLSADGRYLVYVSPKGFGVRLVLWDIDNNREIILPGLGEGFPRDPDVSANATYLTYLDGPVRDTRLRVYDRTRLELQQWPVPVSLAASLRHPTLSGDGQILAVEAGSNRGDRNILLFARHSQQPLTSPGINTDADERVPALSADGRFLAYTSNGGGTLDILIYDRVRERALTALAPNTLHDEDQPRFSGQTTQWLHCARRMPGRTDWVVSPFAWEERP